MLSKELKAEVEAWIAQDPETDTQELLQRTLLAAESGEGAALADIEAWFQGFLEFGTAGLRGPMGPGPSCMNRAVVIRAAAGLSSYLLKRSARRIVVGYDARHHSLDFALDTVGVAAGYGLEAILLPRTLPTPVLAYAIGFFNADAGVMVTASHNPANDNGYKVYLGDGSQIIPPTDFEISEEIAAITSSASVAFSDSWDTADDDVVRAYIAQATELFTSEKLPPIKVAYSPMHGVGREVWSDIFDDLNLGTLVAVAAQADPNPDFPTVAFPNPEEAGATDLLRALAHEMSADVAIAHDPDADRCAMLIPTDKGWRQLRGDEVGVLLAWWAIERARVFKLAHPTGTFASSIVSSMQLEHIAQGAGLNYTSTLTGFKWISKVPDLVFGYEEALGYCVDPAHVRDKDGITASLRICELTAYLLSIHRSVESILDEIAVKYGLFVSDQLSIRMNNLSDIPAAVDRLRNNPPTQLAGLIVNECADLNNGWKHLPPTNGMMLMMDKARIIVRPSGTEPKLKCYLEVRMDTTDVATGRIEANQLLAALKRDLQVSLGI